MWVHRYIHHVQRQRTSNCPLGKYIGRWDICWVQQDITLQWFISSNECCLNEGKCSHNWLPVEAQHLQMAQLHLVAHLKKKKNGIFQVIRNRARRHLRRFGLCFSRQEKCFQWPSLKDHNLAGHREDRAACRTGGVLWSEVKQFSVTWLWLWGQDHPQSLPGSLHLESLLKGHCTGNESTETADWPLGLSASSAHTERNTVNLPNSKCNGQGHKVNVLSKKSFLWTAFKYNNVFLKIRLWLVFGIF